MKRLVLVSLFFFSGFASAISPLDIQKYSAQQELLSAVQRVDSIDGDSDRWMEHFSKMSSLVEDAAGKSLHNGDSCGQFESKLKQVPDTSKDDNPALERAMKTLNQKWISYGVSYCKWLAYTN